MHQLTVRVALCLAAGLLTGCQSAGPQTASRDAAASDQAASAGALSPQVVGDDTGVAPPSNYKAERARRAMQALEFGAGGVTIDADAATELGLPGGRSQADARYRRGMVSLEGNEIWNAIGSIRDAIVMEPGVSEFYVGLGRALLVEREDSKALAAFKTAVSLDPASLDARLRLADAHNRVGDMDASIESFRAALADHPGAVEAHQRLAVLLYYRGDDAGAWAHVHAVEAAGADVPPQFRRLLDARTPETR